jgi:3-isopropylmalate/(R)-2-methylmalate dehydratase large subunit
MMLEHVRAHTDRPFEPQWPDEDADYADRRTLQLDAMEPLVALPDTVLNNSRPVSEVAGTGLDQAFIGSCANGTLEDLEIAARILDGRKVSGNTRLIVTPGTQGIYREALRRGYVQSLMDAGAVVTNATCGACGGGSMGVLGPNETCITASTRNFKGRMGDPSARIFMASPATVAASAIEGKVASPKGYFA